jgi:cell division protein FtsQ
MADDTRDSADRPPRGRLFNKRLKLALVAVVLLLVAGSPFWGPLLMRRMTFFHVHRIEVVGAHYVAPGEIVAKLRVDTMQSVWNPTGVLTARVLTHPGVASAVVRRKLPGTLVVEITERVPVALVPTPTGFRVFDDRGRALPIDPARVSVDAPVLSQRDTALLRFLGAMRRTMPEMYARVNTIAPVGADEMMIEFKSHPVRAMKDVSLERLTEIDPVEADLERKQLRATEIDLRYRDQVIARLP